MKTISSSRYWFPVLFCGLLLSMPGPVGSAAAGPDAEEIYLASVPSLTPDGRQMVFVWKGDLWKVATEGGTATRLTSHPAPDHWPVLSPDGTEVAFTSNRNGFWHVYVMPITGGVPEQITFHSEGFTPRSWTPDGKHIVATGYRDHAGLSAERIFLISRTERHEPQLLFDAYGDDPALSPDGRKVLFVRGGTDLYRKGYTGSRAAQVWLYDRDEKTFRRAAGGKGLPARSPLWKPDGSGFYYLDGRSGCFNVWEHDLEAGSARARTDFTEDSVIIPSLSADGSVMVFRNGFQFYRFEPTGGEAVRPEVIPLEAAADLTRPDVRRRWYRTVWNNDDYGSFDFSNDGLDIVFTTGGDLWVMDTVLREPVQITGDTAIHETEADLAPDGNSIVFLRDTGTRAEVWKTERKDPEQYWWQNEAFTFEQLTDHDSAKSQLSLSPDGKKMAYVRGVGELVIDEAGGGDPQVVAVSCGTPWYDWSPDGRWLCCSLKDLNDNWDVWIVSTEGEREPFNLSRNPDWDGACIWSPDGKIIAFFGENAHRNDVDMYYVWLRREDDETSKRDRSLEEALEVMNKARKKTPKKPDAEVKKEPKEPEPDPEPEPDANPQPDSSDEEPVEPPVEEPVDDKPEEKPPAEKKKIPAEDKDGQVEIDFEDLDDRVREINIEGRPTSPFWHFDSRKIAFTATIGGKKGTYTVELPEKTKPVFLSDKTGVGGRWVKEGSKIFWLADGLPTAYTRKYPIEVYQKTDIEAYHRLGFRLIWRTLRDTFYDAQMNNLDWDAIRIKYEDAAARAPDAAIFSRVIAMLHGELNASHLGFTQNRKDWHPWEEWVPDVGWKLRTVHLGVRFDDAFAGPGLRIAHVLRGGPADKADVDLQIGDIVRRIDDQDVEPGQDLTRVLNRRLEARIKLDITDGEGTERSVTLQPVSYEAARELVIEEGIEANRKQVEALSDGRLAYLNVRRMSWSDFERFEKEIFAEGVDKDGFVIDVRNNTGGFVADRLLTILCRPPHAITRKRNADLGYPRSYLVFTSWEQPIVVLCNQNTVSNGEIFCHAIKTLERGKLVGTPTRAGVISTPSTKILDLGTLRTPSRGWFNGMNGEDMEYTPAVPDVEIWPEPGDLPAGKDVQLETAVDVLLKDLERATAGPTVRTAAELRAAEAEAGASQP